MIRSLNSIVLALLLSLPVPGAPNPSAETVPAIQQKPREKGKSPGDFGYHSLLLEGGAACVVQEKSGSRCLLTAEEYNQQVYTLEMVSSGAFLQTPGKNRADTTRQLAMRSILYNQYKEQKLQSAGLDSLLDTVTAQECHENELRSDTALTKRLLKYYGTHYAASFKTRRIPVYDILAGSDSASIHALSRFLKSQDSLFATLPSGDTVARRKVVARMDSLPWRRAAPEDLGPAAAKAAEALKPYRWTAPIRTPYGHAILRLVDSTWTPERFFLAVRDSLRLVLKGQEGAFLSQAKSYYRSHQSRFPKPDTLFFRLALCPDSACMSDARRGKPLAPASEYSLPATTRKVVKSAYSSRRPDSAWFETPLGFARLVAPEMRRGKGSRPFEEVKAEIFETIDAPVDSTVFASVKCMQTRRRMADLFVPYLYDDVAVLLQKQNVQPGEKTRDPTLRVAIKDARTRFRGEFESWMEGLAVEMPGR